MPRPRLFWVAIAAITATATLSLLPGLLEWLPFHTPESAVIISVPSGERKPDGPRHEYMMTFSAFPPLVRFEVVSAKEVGSRIADDEFVLGAEVDGVPRAYPLNMLGKPGSEVVNDSLGGQPIVATFCGLCETPLVFSRQVDDRILTFHVSGLAIDSSMLIEDVETRSGWIQIEGRAVEGPLQGKTLGQFPAVWIDWKAWRAAHPSTTAVLLSRGSRKYSRTIAGKSAASRAAWLDAMQWGLARNGQTGSWPFAAMAAHPVVNDTFAGLPLLLAFNADSLSTTAFDRRTDGRVLNFTLRGDKLVDVETGSTWNPLTGRALSGPLAGHRLSPVNGTVSTRRAWIAHHPESRAWPSPDLSRE